MLRIEFDPKDTRLALAIGKALTEYAGGDKIRVEIEVGNDAEVKVVGAEYTEEVPVSGAATAEQFDKEVTKGVKPTQDEKGVMFIPVICGQAQEPFYATGPNKGQWKKKKGVDQVEYDRVYGPALAALQDLGTEGLLTGTGVATGPQGTISPTPSQVYSDGELAKQDSSAAAVFGGASPIDETVQENPATPAEVFELYSYLCQNNGAGVANKICEAAGIANGTLIFANPHLAPRLFKELTTQKAQLVAGA